LVNNESNTHYTVLIPAGTYKITQTLRLFRVLGGLIVGQVRIDCHSWTTIALAVTVTLADITITIAIHTTIAINIIIIIITITLADIVILAIAMHHLDHHHRHHRQHITTQHTRPMSIRDHTDLFPHAWHCRVSQRGLYGRVLRVARFSCPTGALARDL
jgi:hypothetical protein